MTADHEDRVTLSFEHRNRIEKLRKAVEALEDDLARAMSEADDLASRTPISRSVVVDGLDEARRLVEQAHGGCTFILDASEEEVDQ